MTELEKVKDKFNTVEVSHAPSYFDSYSMFICLLTALLMLLCCFFIEKIGIFLQIVVVGVSLVPFFSKEAVGLKRTTVNYNEDLIFWVWNRRRTEVKIANVKSFGYRLTKRSRGGEGGSVCLEIYFRTGYGEGDRNKVLLNDIIGTQSMLKVLKGERIDNPIFDIYDFYAELYPQKARGYDRTGYKPPFLKY